MNNDIDQLGALPARGDQRTLPPVGFWSYARRDDELSQGKLSALRGLLMQELQQQYGREPIHLFQDMAAIEHGDEWDRVIRAALDRSSFFIPIITPNFLQSEWCAREVQIFREREKKLKTLHPHLPSRSRVFPIHFIDVEDVDPEDPDALAFLRTLQWFDFRPFRHRSFEDVPVREALTDFAASMRRLLKLKLAGPDMPDRPESEGPEAVPTRIVVRATSFPPAAPAERSIAVGDLLNDIFEVKRFIRAGGMGQVYEGLNVNTGERVAIKVLLPALASDPKITELFHREAMTLTGLSHEALAQYRLLAREPQLGVLYIVMGFIDGVNLADALDRIDAGPDALARLLRRLAAGLGAAHRAGIIHRDISLDNVMLPESDLDRAKIIDFGIAKDMAGALPTIIGGGFAGKLNFVAPEQLGEAGGIGPWTDVYSLALVMLAVARGGIVDMGGSFADAIRKRHAGPDLSAAPPPLRELLSDMLRPDPSERIRSMAEVLKRLALATGTDDSGQLEADNSAANEPDRHRSVGRQVKPRDHVEGRTSWKARPTTIAVGVAAGVLLIIFTWWAMAGPIATDNKGAAEMACTGRNRIVNLNPHGDNFLMVRGEPDANASALDRLGPELTVLACGTTTDRTWTRIVYDPARDGRCDLASVLRSAHPAAAPCRAGWVSSRYLSPLTR